MLTHRLRAARVLNHGMWRTDVNHGGRVQLRCTHFDAEPRYSHTVQRLIPRKCATGAEARTSRTVQILNHKKPAPRVRDAFSRKSRAVQMLNRRSLLQMLNNRSLLRMTAQDAVS